MVAIFVIFTIVAFILVDALVQKSELKRREAALQNEAVRRRQWNVPISLRTLPGGIYTDSGHTWLRLNQDGTANVGIDDFAQNVVGVMDKFLLPKVGQEVRRGDKIFSICQGERIATFCAPVDGVVEGINETLASDPAAVKSDPYQNGWVCSLRPKNLASNLRQMLIAEEAVAWLKSEIGRFREFILTRPFEHTELGRVLQDGGEISSGVLELMDNNTWDEFIQGFLNTSESKTTTA
jgi:glycine cleavage system H protein